MGEVWLCGSCGCECDTEKPHNCFDRLAEKHDPSELNALLEGMASKGETGLQQGLLQYFAEDLPTLDGNQLGKVFRYMRRVRAGLDS